LYGYWFASSTHTTINNNTNINNNTSSITVRFPIAHADDVDWLELALRRLDVAHDIDVTNACVVCRPSNFDRLFVVVGNCNDDRERRLASWVMTSALDCDAIRALLDGLRRGSTSSTSSSLLSSSLSSSSSTTTLSTTSASLRDQIVALCYRAGYTACFDSSPIDDRRRVPVRLIALFFI
jgi:hypothetical protein